MGSLQFVGTLCGDGSFAPIVADPEHDSLDQHDTLIRDGSFQWYGSLKANDSLSLCCMSILCGNSQSPLARFAANGALLSCGSLSEVLARFGHTALSRINGSLSGDGALGLGGSLALVGTLQTFDSLRMYGALSQTGSLVFVGTNTKARLRSMVLSAFWARSVVPVLS